jgi:hypothetical protein
MELYLENVNSKEICTITQVESVATQTSLPQ